MPNICIGAGNRPIDGFINFDLFTSDKVNYGRANNLPLLSDNSVDIIFSNAVFEHIDPSEYSSLFEEWHRIIKRSGNIVCLGIPFFDLIAEFYLDGILDLNKVQNYTTGVIEYCQSAELLMGQIHKSLFNIVILKNIFSNHGFNCHVFNYCYPEENLPVNLGVIGFLDSKNDIRSTLLSIPTINDYINLDTIII